MGGGPEDHGAQRPESGEIGNAGSSSRINGQQAGDDLRGKTIQPQIYQPESKGNPEGWAPPRNVGLELDRFGLRFGLKLWDRLKLGVHSRPFRKRLRIGPELSLRWHEAPSCNHPRSFTAPYEVCCGFQGLSGVI